MIIGSPPFAILNTSKTYYHYPYATQNMYLTKFWLKPLRKYNSYVFSGKLPLHQPKLAKQKLQLFSQKVWGEIPRFWNSFVERLNDRT